VLVLVMVWLRDPRIAMLVSAAEHVQFVIAEDALGDAGRDERAHELDDGGTVGASVAEIADEDHSAMGRVFETAVRVAEV
jgi:hypothetical protein